MHRLQFTLFRSAAFQFYKGMDSFRKAEIHQSFILGMDTLPICVSSCSVCLLGFGSFCLLLYLTSCNNPFNQMMKPIEVEYGNFSFSFKCVKPKITTERRIKLESQSFSYISTRDSAKQLIVVLDVARDLDCPSFTQTGELA